MWCHFERKDEDLEIFFEIAYKILIVSNMAGVYQELGNGVAEADNCDDLSTIDYSGLRVLEDMASRDLSGVNINDVIEVIQTDGMLNSTVAGAVDSRRSRAYVKILEQPAAKALRFRYECEGRSAGSIPGVNSTAENKTFPTIQIVGYQGRAVVVVSCVTRDSPYRPHPHNLVGKEGCSRGVCTLRMNSDTISFSNLGIQCVKKKDIEEALKVREEIRVDPFRTGFSHRVQPSNIDLNSVRLCFQVFLEGPKKDEFMIPLRPIVSEPIYDKKAMSDLTICKLSDCSASVAGGREIILLCEKVAKEDIQIRFYEEVEGDLTWEAQGDFTPAHVHKQVAISFRTPKYRDLDVDRPVKVWVQLRRPSDGASSEPVSFILTPLDAGRPAFWSLHRALLKKGDYGTFTEILTAEAHKRKLDAISPVSESKKQKDSLISGGGLVTLPPPPLTVYESEPKVLKPNLELVDDAEKAVELGTEEIAMQVDKKSKNDDAFEHFEEKEKISLGDLMDRDSSFEALLDKAKDNSLDGLLTKAKDENSFDDLITQVAELDEIYCEARNRIQLEDTPMNMHCTEMFDDSQTYTSLQLAMKNPIEVGGASYEEMKPTSRLAVEKLPPLPPKRVKQTPPDNIALKRKRKMGGETSPPNVFNLPHDEDSRTTFVGSLSPDRKLLHVKREPREASPTYYSNLSPYQATSPGPPSPHNSPSPVPGPSTVYSPYPGQQFNVRVAGGGGLVDLNPGVSAMFTQPTLNNLNAPGVFSKPLSKPEPDRTTVFDMDSQQCSLELNLCNLDSAELARMASYTEANLSENLSSHLTLSERLDGGERTQDQAMTDSFTRVANNAIQELVSLSNNMYASNLGQPE